MNKTTRAAPNNAAGRGLHGSDLGPAGYTVYNKQKLW